jgi:peptide-methionine (R)-S-oxide reductase
MLPERLFMRNTAVMSTSRTGYDLTPLSETRIHELAAGFSPEERHVILHQGTERPFCGLLLDNKNPGTYVCRLCGLPLFASNSKFHSGTGWPSFFQPYDPEHVREIEDISHGMRRVEIRCARCDAHLGHVFDDGPPPTGLRYCLNSVSMEFKEEGQPLALRD